MNDSDIVVKTLLLAEKNLNGRKTYNLMTSSSHYAYLIYLSKLEEHLKLLPKTNDIGTIITYVLGWNVRGSASIINAIKNLYINILLISRRTV